MIIKGKDYNINNLVEEINIDKNIPKKRSNGIVLRDSHIETLKKYKIDYMNHSSLNSLIFELEQIINEEEDVEDLECLQEELAEINYYNYTNK